MSDETNSSPFDITEWEADGFQSTVEQIAHAAFFPAGTDIGAIRGFVNGQPVVVLTLTYEKDQTNPERVVTTPTAILLMGDVVDLVTFPEGGGEELRNPDYIAPPEPAQPAPASV